MWQEVVVMSEIERITTRVRKRIYKPPTVTKLTSEAALAVLKAKGIPDSEAAKLLAELDRTRRTMIGRMVCRP
jgi:hypothetical protein